MSSGPDVKVEMKVSLEEVQDRLGNLDKKAGTIFANAAKRAMTTGKKVIKQETAARYNVRQKDVAEALKESRDKKTRGLTWKLTYKDPHRNLFSFGTKSVVTPKFPIRSSSPYNPDPKFYSANVEKSTGKQALDGKPKPFVQISKNSQRIALFERESNDPRAEIRGVAAPAIPQIIKNKKVIERFDEEVGNMLRNRIDHEISRVLGGNG